MSRLTQIISRSIVVTLLIATFFVAATPARTLAATWEELQSAISAARNNLSNLPAQSAEFNVARNIVQYAERTPRNVWEAMAEDQQATMMRNLSARAESDPAARAKKVNELQSNQDAGCFFSFEFKRCILTPVITWIASWFLTIGGAVLTLGGSLFDLLVGAFVLNFTGTLDSDTFKILPLISTVWTFFRDLANIFVIAIFVFIAISLILGLKEYGQKKLVARVLIIAVLMNFSLLFAKLVIDTSNFFASAFYTQTVAQGTSGDKSLTAKFLAPMGMKGIWDTKTLLDVYAKNTDTGLGMAFMVGLFGGIALLIIGFILLYGALLLAARAVLFIFLMMIAPLAFATYLAPHFQSGALGWTSWWKSLINNAIFAPLLMIFLSISIIVVSQASANTGGQTLGGAFADPSNLQSGSTVIIIYLLGAGLLFASIRAASSLAGSIGEASLGRLSGSAAAFGGAAGLGFMLRNTAGRFATKRSSDLEHKMAEARIKGAETGDYSKFEKFSRQKARMDKLASSNFTFGKAGQGVQGFADKFHAKGVAAEADAKARLLTSDDKKLMAAEAAKAAGGAFDTRLGAKQEAKTAAESKLTAAQGDKATIDKEVAAANDQTALNRTTAKPEKQAAEAQHEITKIEKTKLQTDHSNIEKAIQKKIDSTSGSKREEHVAALIAKRAEHQSAIDAQDARITQAKAEVENIEFDITKPLREVRAKQTAAEAKIQLHTNEVAAANTEIASLIANRDRIVKREGDRLHAENMVKADENQRAGVAEVGNKAAGWFAGETGRHATNHHLEEKLFKKESITDRFKKLLKDQAAEEKPDTH